MCNTRIVAFEFYSRHSHRTIITSCNFLQVSYRDSFSFFLRFLIRHLDTPSRPPIGCISLSRLHVVSCSLSWFRVIVLRNFNPLLPNLLFAILIAPRFCRVYAKRGLIISLLPNDSEWLRKGFCVNHGGEVEF